MTEHPTQLRLSVDWELWVVEQLLFTAKLEEIVEALAAQGIDALTAVAEAENPPGTAPPVSGQWPVLDNQQKISPRR